VSLHKSNSRNQLSEWMKKTSYYAIVKVISTFQLISVLYNS